MYDGQDEFLVVVKEKSQKEQQHTQEEIHRKIGKAWSWSYMWFIKMD